MEFARQKVFGACRSSRESTFTENETDLLERLSNGGIRILTSEKACAAAEEVQG